MNRAMLMRNAKVPLYLLILIILGVCVSRDLVNNLSLCILMKAAQTNTIPQHVATQALAWGDAMASTDIIMRKASQMYALAKNDEALIAKYAPDAGLICQINDTSTQSLAEQMEKCEHLWFAEARVYQTNQDWGSLIAFTQTALEMNDSWGDGWYLLGVGHNMSDNVSSAIDAFEHGVDFDIHFRKIGRSDVLYQLVSLYGDPNKEIYNMSLARKYQQMALDIDEFTLSHYKARLLANLGDQLLIEGLHEEALTSYYKAVEVCDYDDVSFVSLAWAIWKIEKDYISAREYLAYITQKHPEHIYGYLHWAELALKAGYMDDAKWSIERAREIDPDNPSVIRLYPQIIK